jgi:hypothetical protein
LEQGIFWNILELGWILSVNKMLLEHAMTTGITQAIPLSTHKRQAVYLLRTGLEGTRRVTGYLGVEYNKQAHR